MKGSHYNRAWLVHNTVSEALERLLMRRFFGELNIQLPSQLAELVAEPDDFNQNVVDSMNFSFNSMKILKVKLDVVCTEKLHSTGCST